MPDAADVLTALTQQAIGVVGEKWANLRADLTPYLHALAHAVVDVQARHAAGQMTEQQADYVLHGQELAINSFMQYSTVLAYATAQALLNVLMRTAAGIIQTATGLSLSWI